MTLPSAHSIRTGTTVAAAVSLAIAAVVTGRAVAAPSDADTARLAGQYAAWAGSRANAESIVNGLRTGSNITLVSSSAGHARSLAGFKPSRTLSGDEVAHALASARATLASLGIKHPNADQIQASLIGGEVPLPNGRTRLVQGSVPDAPAIAAR